MAQEKLILIDGHSIIHRAFYGIPDLTNRQGIHTNAVYGFLNILFKIMDEEQAQYLAVAFDLPAPTFRHKMYEAYKGTRKAMPEELRSQVPMMQQMLRAMGVPLMMMEGYEADDLIGTVSLQAEQAGLQVSIVSGDRDLLQLASETTLVRIPKTKKGGTQIEDYYAADVLAAYGVTPLQIIDLKGLMGDASDNIPGVPGIGEKTAVKILTQFHSVEEAIAHVEEVTPARAKNQLKENVELAQLSKTLATINRQSPFVLDFAKARIENLFTEEARELCREWELKSILPRFEQKKEKPEASVEVLTEQEQIASVLAQAKKSATVGLHYLRAQHPDETLYGIALAYMQGEEMKSCYMPVENPFQQEILCQSIRELVKDAKRTAFVDLKGALAFLEPDICVEMMDKLVDISVAAYLIDPLKGSYPYDELAREYAQVSYPAGEEILEKKKGLGEQELSRQVSYGVYHANAALLCCAHILNTLEEEGLTRLFVDVEMPMIFVLREMERQGIMVRGDRLKEFSNELDVQIKEMEQKIWQEAGKEFNILSPKQLGAILFEDLKLPGGKKTKTGYSTSADVLEKLADEYAIVADVLSYRQVTKLKSTYADGLYAFIGPDNRIHGTFHQKITATGRISSADPNLQNIPVRTQLGREFRKVFVPKEGTVFVDADYSQIELRVLAHMSEDANLIAAYKDAQDIHAATASLVFGVPLDEVTDLQRRNAKAVNFGIVYGISAFGLSRDLSIAPKEAQKYIDQYFESYPGIKKFLDGSVAFAKENGYAKTLFGRKRPMPELASANFMQRSFGERVAMNAPIQGSAADIIKIAMVRVYKRLRAEGLASALILQVHDELIIEAKTEELEQVKQIMREEMMGAADLSVSLEIDMHEGASWYDAK